MRYLITGDLGFIGTALKAELDSVGDSYVTYDIRRSLAQDVRSETYFHFTLGLEVHNSGIDGVVHLAAEVGKLNCEENVEQAIDTNVRGALAVAKTCARLEVPLIYVSTSEVYGDQGSLELDEDCCTEIPSSGMYALTKRAAEGICETYAPEGLKIIRPTMPYGPGVPPGPGRRALDNLIYQALTGQPMIVHRGAARSWCWIGDVASGIRYVLHNGASGIYNVGRDDDERTMTELAEMIAVAVEGSSYQAIIDEVEPPAMQTPIKRISCAKLRNLGWAPEVDLEEGLQKMVEWIGRYIEQTSRS